eukprot:scaffold473_cov132-Cylindrotheca_fusiformis.AAC.8
MAKRKLCDVCGLRDGHQKLEAIQCTECQVSVHKKCYGMDSYQKNNFICWACRAVGQSFQVEARDHNGRRREVLQSSRPTSCVLCSISDGTHAMHPLYDAPGRKGRQMNYLDESTNTIQLAWVHTICGFFFTGRGFLYGCSRDGNYDYFEDSESTHSDADDDDDRSLNPELLDESQENDDFGEYAPVHHFVYRSALSASDEDQIVDRKRHHMKQLKCYVCGSDDTPKDVLRMCLQCNANDDDEWIEFRGRHPSLADCESCTTALHVGCARWGGNNKHNVKRVYYFPGSDDMDSVLSLFCNAHAEDVDQKYQKRLKAKQTAEPAEQQPTDSSAQPMKTFRTATARGRRGGKKDQILNRVSNDLIQRVSPIQNLVLRQDAYTQRKKYWKRMLSRMPLGNFTAMWKKARLALAEAIQNPDRNATRRDVVLRVPLSVTPGWLASAHQAVQANEQPRDNLEDSSTNLSVADDDEFEWNGIAGDPDDHLTSDSEDSSVESNNLCSQVCRPVSNGRCQCSIGLLEPIELCTPKPHAVHNTGSSVGQGPPESVVTDLCFADQSTTNYCK